MKGNSFSNGDSPACGQAVGNGPYGAAEQQGWDIRPVSHWDFTGWRIYR